MQTTTIVRDFISDLSSRGLTEAQLMGLDIPRRKEVFLRWKWFDSSAFNELEGSRRSLVAMMTPEDVKQIANEDERKYWTGVLKFEKYCTEVLKRIGILPSDAVADAEVRKAVAAVGGQVSGGYRRSWND